MNMKKKYLFIWFLSLFALNLVGVNIETNHIVNDIETDGDTTIALQKPTTAGDDYKFRFGGYGEIVASWKDYGLNRWNGQTTGSTRDHHATIALPRFIMAFDYKFSKRWALSAEVEFEGGGTGTEYEIEVGSGSENGEYETETETGGEVALEQFHLTYLAHPSFNVRMGHMIVPVGITNTHHEPIYFFGTRRPEGETTILPSTWHETGIEFFGKFGKGLAKFDYEAMIIAGANPNGFDKYNWIKKGKQNYFEADNLTRPAYVGRLNWHGVDGLRVGTSLYYCGDAGRNADKLNTYKGFGNISLLIWSADAQYINRWVEARANIITGRVSHADDISWVNRIYSKDSPYNRTPNVAKRALTYSCELGLNVKNIFNGSKNFPNIIPFAHYEYYNPQEKGEKSTSAMDDRCQVSLWTMGLNWRPLPNLVVKADYTTRQIGTRKIFGTSNAGYNSENEFSIGVAYIGWFIKHNGEKVRCVDYERLNQQVNELRREVEILKAKNAKK